MATNTHHILYPRTAWQAHSDLNKIRNWITIKLPKEIHDELHAQIGYVPPLPVAEAGVVWSKVKQLHANPMLKLMVLTAVIREEIANAHDYYTARSMSLTHEALTAQLEYLNESGMQLAP